ncbi:MAG: hypothetical protein OXK73_04105 [Rhodospirillaceae bacterium]|nr:hypothetical protein [Rhodospirillaceae bacterium]
MTEQVREECEILIYVEGEREDKPPHGRRFSLSDFGGSLPATGESILSPLADGNADRSAPVNRTVWEVSNRYFLPHSAPEKPLVALIVKQRPARDSERRLLGWS